MRQNSSSADAWPVRNTRIYQFQGASKIRQTETLPARSVAETIEMWVGRHCHCQFIATSDSGAKLENLAAFASLRCKLHTYMREYINEIAKIMSNSLRTHAVFRRRISGNRKQIEQFLVPRPPNK